MSELLSSGLAFLSSLVDLDSASARARCNAVRVVSRACNSVSSLPEEEAAISPI